MQKIKSSEITTEQVYRNRRKFMKKAGAAVIGGLLAPYAAVLAARQAKIGEQLRSELTPFKSITNYNNYYEFTTDKEKVAELVNSFQVTPWELEVTGEVNKPGRFSIGDLKRNFPQEERIYRLRCVEGWSMVIPWTGFPLASLLRLVEPTSHAKYVRFISVYRPAEMPGQKDSWYDWPYTEGLRLDEAMNDLALLVTGLYGKELPRQDGAPIRLAVPWKYGFKSIKSIVKIELVRKQPDTFWTTANSREYGFYANVNPNVPHPRWSQATERRIGEFRRRKTLMFNGYQEEVASLYAGMDLRKNY